jgi:hypothetical protein
MSDSAMWARIMQLTSLLNVLRARIAALERRVAAAEQSLQQRWTV